MPFLGLGPVGKGAGLHHISSWFEASTPEYHQGPSRYLRLRAYSPGPFPALPEGFVKSSMSLNPGNIGGHLIRMPQSLWPQLSLFLDRKLIPFFAGKKKFNEMVQLAIFPAEKYSNWATCYRAFKFALTWLIECFTSVYKL